MALRDHRIFNRGRQTQSDVKNEQVHDDIQGLIEKNIFDTAVVAEFISDPEEYLATAVEIDASSLASSLRAKTKSDGRKINSTMLEELTTGTKKVENPYLVQIMPKNSIIAYNITNNKNHSSPDPEIFFPFFPAHFGMPVKTGEQVWCFYENIGKKRVGYWLFRKSATMQVDDLNYTFLERQIPIGNLISTKNDPTTKLNKGKFKALVENLGNKFEDFRTGGDGSGMLKVDIDNLLIDSISYKEQFVGEPVPRHSRKCSDLVLQGSNNTIITMTHLDKAESGTIVIAAGKSIGTVSSGAPTVKNTRGDTAKSFEHEEIDKLTMLHSDEKIENEGSIDGSKASLTITEDEGGSIFAQAASSSFLTMSTDQITLTKQVSLEEEENPLSTITMLDDRIGIEGPAVVSIRSPGPKDPLTGQPSGEGEIKLAYTGDTENPTEAADILMNDGDQPYVRYDELKILLDKLAGDAAFVNFIISTLLNAASALPPVAALVNSLDAARDAAQNAGSVTFNLPSPELDSDGNPTGNVVETPVQVSASILGENITQSNFQTEVTDRLTAMASSRIFGS